MGVTVIWIDVEGTTTRDTMRTFGIDPKDNIFLFTPEEGEVLTVEKVRDKIEDIANVFQANNPDKPILIIWDSLAHTQAEAEIKDGFNTNQPGVKAKSIAFMSNKLGQIINNTNIGFIIINQARDDMDANPMFPKIKSTGGRAMEHWASLRLEVVKGKQVKEKVELPTGGTKDEYIGHIFRIKTVKSKVSTPNRQAEAFLISQPYVGVDFVENVYRQGVEEYNLISKGAWRTYKCDSGEEIKLRHAEWVPFLQSEEGLPVLTELFLKQLATFFPDGYAPLDNENLDVTKDYFLNIADKMYNGEVIDEYTTAKNKPKKEESKEEEEDKEKKEAK